MQMKAVSIHWCELVQVFVWWRRFHLFAKSRFQCTFLFIVAAPFYPQLGMNRPIQVLVNTEVKWPLVTHCCIWLRHFSDFGAFQLF